MLKKTCKYCGESFELRPGKPGYANECPDCLHEKTRPQVRLDLLATYVNQYPERRHALSAAKEALAALGVDGSEVDGFIASCIRAGTQK